MVVSPSDFPPSKGILPCEKTVGKSEHSLMEERECGVFIQRNKMDHKGKWSPGKCYNMDTSCKHAIWKKLTIHKDRIPFILKEKLKKVR